MYFIETKISVTLFFGASPSRIPGRGVVTQRISYLTLRDAFGHGHARRRYRDQKNRGHSQFDDPSLTTY